MLHTDLETAVTIATEACRLARFAQDAIVAAGDAVSKDDRSPVTVADLAIQVVVSRRLADAFPGDRLLAEESSAVLERQPELTHRVLALVRRHLPDVDARSLVGALDRGDAAAAVGRTWVLDPIDGSKGFLRGDQFAVALALVVDGNVSAGVLGCPNLAADPRDDEAGRGVVFAATRGAGATAVPLDGGEPRAIAVDVVEDPAAARFCESVESAHADHSEQAEIARRLGITAPPVRIDSQCKYGVVSRGEASIYLRLPKKKDYREKVWDHAAGAIVLEEAGGRVTDLAGQPLDFSQGRLLGTHVGIVATNGRLHDRVVAACREVVGLDD
jgi:3'(2'), 5'-bisphosphate nucleotidase